MRLWFDMTAPAHPVVFRPVIAWLREQGHDVTITARDYAQTLELLELHDMPYTAVGAHGGASRARKLFNLLMRTRAVRRAAGGPFDLAVAHGSNELAIAAAFARIPAVNMFDYEFAIQQHNIGCRLARRVITPDAIPPSRLARFGARGEKLKQFPGLKEEYYLADFTPDPGVFDALGADRDGRFTVIIRPPPDVSLYHRRANRLFPAVTRELGTREDVRAIVLPRTDTQRRELQALGYPSLTVADHAVDAQSLIALADLVVSAGGTMNREAVALGTPVYTTFGGRLGGVDEQLIRERRLRPLTDPNAIELVRRTQTGPTTRRDPALIARMIVEAVP
jgi:predicted glycosyltransferase